MSKSNMQKQTLTQIKKALRALAQKGWIKSNRRHNTGIGKTLEDHLDIVENNIALPDFGVMELKSQRINTISMMTLFTKSPEGITNAEIRKRFGYPDKEFPKTPQELSRLLNILKTNLEEYGILIERVGGRKRKIIIRKKGENIASTASLLSDENTNI